MIRNVAELLHKLIEKEKEKLKEFDFIKHGTIIGNMYEGLTASILQKFITPKFKYEGGIRPPRKR